MRNCQKCQGKGYYETTLRDLSGKQPDSLGVLSIVPCDFPTCRNGKVTEETIREEYEKLRLWGVPFACCPTCQ